MYISIGSDCVTKTRIEEMKYNKEKQESNLFDWVLSDLESVNYILKSGVKGDTFNIKNWEVLTKTIDDKWAVKNKYCYFISLHDASSSLTYNEAFHIVSDKFIRRLQRFYEKIVTEENIHFIGVFDKSNPIHTGKNTITTDTLTEFINIVKQYRASKPFTVTVIVEDTCNIDAGVLPNYVKVIDSNAHYVKDWYRFFLNWNDIMSNVP